MLGESQARRLSERVLKLSKAEEAEVSLKSGTIAHLRFARNTASTSGSERYQSLTVRSTFGKRSGSATVNQFDDATLEKVVRRSEKLARLTPEDPELVPALGPQRYSEVEAYFESTEQQASEAMATGAAQCISEAKKNDLVAAGFTQVFAGDRCLANSKDLFAYHKATGVYAAETARTPDGRGSGWASGSANRIEDIDYGAISRTAAQKALASVSPKRLEPGDYVTILEPSCVANLVELMFDSVDARDADEGRSYFAAEGGNRIGETLFPDSINVRSDPTDGRAPVRPWDRDGVPRVAQTWIAGGTLKTLAYDRFWASKQGVNAVPYPANILMSGGGGTVDDLVKSTERGVLVTSLWYIRALDPRTLSYTGLTRDGVFWIEDGRIAYPVNNFRWNESPIRMLKNTVTLSAPTRVAPRPSRSANVVVPALKVQAFNFASVSQAI